MKARRLLRVHRLFRERRQLLPRELHLLRDRLLLALLPVEIRLQFLFEVLRFPSARPLPERDSVLQIRRLPVCELRNLVREFQRLLVAPMLREQPLHLREDRLLARVSVRHRLLRLARIAHRARLLEEIDHPLHLAAAHPLERIAERLHRLHVLARRQAVALVFAEHHVELAHEPPGIALHLLLARFALAETVGGERGRRGGRDQSEEQERMSFHGIWGTGTTLGAGVGFSKIISPRFLFSSS